MKKTIKLIYFTNPLCSWSWGFEPVWQRLKTQFTGKFNWQYCIGAFNDEESDNLNEHLDQMASIWMQTQYMTGQPINLNALINDPPLSSVPASAAYKCIEKQSPVVADLFLSTIRQKMMIEGKNISKQSIIFSETYQLAKKSFVKIDLDQFHSDYVFRIGHELLLRDNKMATRYQIKRYPTLVFRTEDKILLRIEDYVTYHQLLTLMKPILKDLKVSNLEKIPQDN